jgi:hypothetical protein
MEKRTASLLFFVLVGVIAIGLAGCATGPTATAPTKTLPEMLKTAGFKAYPAASPEQVKHLKTCPSETLMIQERKGVVDCYAFADQKTKTMYIGDEAAYGRFKKALEEQEQKIEEQRIQNDPQFLQLWMGSQGGG